VLVNQCSLLNWPGWLQNYEAWGCSPLISSMSHQACNLVQRRCRRISAFLFHTNTDWAFPFHFARFREWRPSRADRPFWQPLRALLKRPESHLFVFFRGFWFTGPLFKFASSWLQIVGNVIDFRHDVVVKVQVYNADSESSPFLLRERSGLRFPVLGPLPTYLLKARHQCHSKPSGWDCGMRAGRISEAWGPYFYRDFCLFAHAYFSVK